MFPCLLNYYYAIGNRTPDRYNPGHTCLGQDRSGIQICGVQKVLTRLWNARRSPLASMKDGHLCQTKPEMLDSQKNGAPKDKYTN